MTATTRALDGVGLAVLNNRLQGVVRAMTNTLYRTARSGVINIAHDFSCCVISGDDELLAFADSLPIHVLSGPDLMVRSMRELHPEFARGDAFLHNSPYHGNSHAADHSILVPVFDDEGRHRLTVLAKAHQADCGNAKPTTYAADARDVYEEGAPIFPCVKAQVDYRDVEDVIRMCRMRIRIPDQWHGDHLALLGAARIGERQLLALAAEVGWETLEAYTRAWFDYSEERMAAAIARLPAGRVVTESGHDPFPGVPAGIPVRAVVEVRPDEGMLEVDLRDNVDCQPSGLNLSEGTARTAVLTGIFNSLEPDVPVNGGSFRRVRTHLRENCAVGIPRHPASCSVATTNLADRVANAVQRALAELVEGAGMAEVGPSQPPSLGVASGLDPRPGGRPFVHQFIVAITGGAGGPWNDGWLNQTLAGNAGMARRDSIEIDELRVPVRILEQRILPDTEGAGRLRGAPGARCEYGPVGCSIEVMYGSDGCVGPALGARGGLPGGRADQFKRDRSGALSRQPPYARVRLDDGETIVSISTGGGGYGPPHERDPERVRHDVAEGWVGVERAREVYRVALDAAGHVDAEATAALRQEAR